MADTFVFFTYVIGSSDRKTLKQGLDNKTVADYFSKSLKTDRLKFDECMPMSNTSFAANVEQTWNVGRGKNYYNVINKLCLNRNEYKGEVWCILCNCLFVYLHNNQYFYLLRFLRCILELCTPPLRRSFRLASLASRLLLIRLVSRPVPNKICGYLGFRKLLILSS